MSRLVMKFGGTSVANVDRIRNAARHVERECGRPRSRRRRLGDGGKTNELVARCNDAATLRRARI